MPWIVKVVISLGAHSTSFELEEPAPDTIAAQDVEVLALVDEGNTSNLSEEVESLLRLEGLRVDDVDKVCFFCSHQHALPRPDGRKLQGANTGHFRAQCTDWCGDSAAIGPTAGVPNFDRFVLEASCNGPAIVCPVACETEVLVAFKTL